MRRLLLAAVLLTAFGCSSYLPESHQDRLDRAESELAAASTDVDRFYALNDAAKSSIELDKTDDARKYAEELLVLMSDFEDNWNYGNAVHDANMVLGRVAVKEGRIDDAKDFLIKAGETPGSPQLDSFGPNMSLAKDLLEIDEKEAVLEYFELCRKFWDMGHDDLDKWSKKAKAGKVPYFGANLVY